MAGLLYPRRLAPRMPMQEVLPLVFRITLQGAVLLAALPPLVGGIPYRLDPRCS